MALTDKVRPINDKHSIREAVISLFLANPIIKPERFKDLIETDFKTIFQQFEPLSQVQFQFKNQIGLPVNVSPPEILNNIGFKFTSFSGGQPVRVLQGLNDKLNNRTFISYHALNYMRWAPFFEDYLHTVSSISKYTQDIFITAISLHYIDQFLWIGNSSVDLNLIFNKNADSIPKDFFTTTINNYSIVSEKAIDPKGKYLDRLEITVDNIIRPSITISHNVTQPLTEIIDLRNLLENEDFKSILTKAHLHNKDFLKNLLSEPICKMINLL
jgi:uncharacterized protein (TIGR04255 family)